MKQPETTPTDEQVTEERSLRDDRPPARQTTTQTTTYSTFRRHPIRWAILGGLSLLLLLGLLALSALVHLIRHADDRGLFNGVSGQYSQQMHEGFRGGRDYRQAPLSDSTFVHGVVTAVNGDSFTVAGNGTSKVVKTNSSTVYNNSGNKVAVNDTVSVMGTTNGETFTATRVYIRNR